MEPRPLTRRENPTATPTTAPPAPDGTGHDADAGGYGPTDPYATTAPYDPYTAPEAHSPFGGGYGDAAPYGAAADPAAAPTRLRPLADEPVFYPNPGLPPNRPAYDPSTATYDTRSQYALHPVGRVPPDHQPLNLRPAPPPAPPVMAPANRDNLIKGILAGVIGLLAVIALVAAVLTFANGGFSDDDGPTTPTEAAGLPGGAVGSGSPSPAASGSVASSGVPSAVTGTVPSGGAPASASVPAGEGSAAASTDGAPAAGAASGDPAAADSPAATASGDAEVAADGDAASDDAAGASPPTDEDASAGSSARAGASSDGDASPAAAPSGDIADYLPRPAALPAGFDAPSDEGERDLETVAGSFVSADADTAEAEADLEEWGWRANRFVVYDAVPQPADEDINRYGVSVHQFATPEGAAEALPAFAAAFGPDPTDLSAEEPIGDDVVGFQTTNDDGNLAVLYVLSGSYILKIDTASITGDPLPAAIELARELTGT